MDYCNSIFGSTSTVHLHPLHCVLNAVAGLIVKRRKFDRITDTLHDELNWLPVQYRHTYKICFLVYKCFHGTAPSYLSLRSASNSDLMYLLTNLVRYGQRSFIVISPRTWNQFAQNIRDPSLSVEDLKLCYLRERIMCRNAHS